jgi:hypothetical protein
MKRFARSVLALCTVLTLGAPLAVATGRALAEEPEQTPRAPAEVPIVAPSATEPKEPGATRAHTDKAAGKKSARKGAKTERPKPAPRPKTAYDLAREAWHAPAPADMCEQWRTAKVPDLVIQPHGKDISYVLRPASRQGGFDEAQLDIAKQAFGSWDKGPTPHPRTLDLVYAATLHFNAPYVTLISGVRKDRGGSRHSHGLAADIVLPGVEDEELAAFFRAQGFCGVGTYPRSGFVHIDTRDQSYFWIDSSKPNQRGRVVQVRKDESSAADAAAVERGNGGFINPPRLQKALNVRLARRRKAHVAKAQREAARSPQTAAP